MKIFVKGVLAFLLIFSINLVTAQVGVVAPPDACGGQGEQSTFSITGVNLDSIRGMQFTLNYDPTQIDIIELNEGSVLGGIANASNPSPGILIFSWVINDIEGQSLPDGTVLLDVVVEAIGAVATTESLSFSSLEVETSASFPNPAPSTATDGTFTVECAAIGNPLVLTLSAADAACDDTGFGVDVVVSGFDTVNSLQFTLNWDPSIIDYVSVGNFAPLDGLDASNFGPVPASGILSFSWFDGVGYLANGDVLFTVYFDVQGNVNDLSGITFGNNPTPIEAGVETAPNVSTPIPVVTTDDTFTVIDTEAPSVTCPADLTITNILGNPTAVVNGIAPVSVSDNCGPFTVSWEMIGASSGSGANDASGSTVNIGTTLFSYEAEDAYGNIGSCSFNVTLNDTLTIRAVTPDAECGDGNYIVDINADYFTNLQGLQFTIVWDPSVLLLNGVVNNNMPATAGFGELGNDTLTFSWFDNALTGQSFPNDYTMFSMDFSVVGTPGDVSPVRFIGQPTPIEASTDGSVPLVEIPIRLYDNNTNVVDNLAPVVNNAPTDITVDCLVEVPAAADLTAEDQCDGTLTAAAVDVQSTGNCDFDLLITRSWTFTDAVGNSTVATQYITVIYVDAPPAPVGPADAVYSCAADVPAGEDLTSVDSCGVMITASPVETITQGSCANDFVLVRTWTFSDPCGNASVVSQTITVLDDEAPVAPAAPADAQYSCATDVPAAEDLTAADNCDGDITASAVEVVTQGSCVNDFVIVRTWTFTDICGNSSSVSQTITVLDDEAPVAPAAPADALYSCAAEVPAAEDLTAVDNCDGDITASAVEVVTQGSCVNDFVIVRTWTFTDVCGNSSSVSQTITVLDDEAPVAPAAPADLVLECADAVPAAVELSAEDNCDGTINVMPTETITDGGCVNKFTLVRTWTFTDGCGNSSSVSQTIVVDDSTVPVLSGVPADVTVECDNVPAVAVVTATDNCEGVVLNFVETVVNGNCPSNYTITRTWTATDACGQTAVGAQVITVEDTTDPVLGFTPPADLTLQCASEVPAAFMPTANDVSDNCTASGDIIIDMDEQVVSGSCPNDFTINRSWTVSDACGNSVSISQTITVDDNTAPVISCQDVTIELDQDGNASTSVDDVVTLVNENCGTYSAVLSGTDFSCMDIGANTVTATVTDACGNASNCTVSVTVEDNLPPVMHCPSDLTVNLDPGACDIILSYNVTAEDNCESMLTTTFLSTTFNNNNNFAGNMYDLENISSDPITITHFDVNLTANVGFIATFDVYYTPNTYVGNTASPANWTLLGSNSVVAQGVGNPSSLMVGGLTIQPGESYGIYVALTSYDINTNRLAYTNGNNVYTDGSLQLTAGVGKGFPTFTGSTFNSRIWNGNVYYTLQIGAPPVLEQVDGTGLTSGDFFPIGTTTQTWVATDNEGNSSSCTWDYTVLEFPNPIASLVCNDNLIVALDPDCQAVVGADQILEGGPYGCYDDYTVEIFQGSTNLGNLLGSDQIGMTLDVVVTDPETGNFCEGQLFVEDNLPPSITCEDVTIFCTESSAVGDVPNPDASDSCGPVSLDYSESTLDGVCGDDYIEIITRLWTATDESGNTASCSQNVTVARPTLDDVDFPQDFNDIELPSLDCTNPDTEPTNTGFPTIAGIEFMANDVCELQVVYTDLIIDICEGSYKVLRNWTVTENCTDEYVVVEQIITVMDKTEPVINCPDDFVAGTSFDACSADVQMPFAFVSDDCSSTGSISVDISSADGTMVGSTLMDLGLGAHAVTYTATDACGNSSSCSVTVTVEDDVEPVAVCDEVTAVSLTNDGTAKVCTATFDDGSYDNCAILAYKVKRQDQPSFVQFADCVEFGCEDVGETIVVRMRVYDIVGNNVFTENDPDARFNECTVEVVVSDKMKPEITCPANKTLDCDEFESDVWDGITASGPGVPVFKLPENVQIGFYADTYDNCGVDRVNVIQQGSVDQCGEGAYTRIYTAVDKQGLTATCVQIITIQNSTPFNSTGIDWPGNIQLNTCGSGLSPDELLLNPNVNANDVQPQITEDGCDLVGVSYKDTEAPIASPGCVKLIRKWTVVDWCQPDASFALGYVTWEYNQMISIFESSAPVINSVCEDITVCGYEDSCEPIPVTLSIDATDDCTDAEDLVYYYQIDAFYDINEPGSPTYDFNSNFNPFEGAGNPDNVADGSYPIGTHLIYWRVEDGCGNVSTCKYTFTVQDCKPPAPICKMLATAVVPADGTVTINVSSIENGDSYDNCTPYEQIIFSYEPNAIVTEKTFTCDDVGTPVDVTVYATDEYGNQNSCQSVISIIDPFGLCDLTPTATVAGVIETEKEIPVGLTTVSVTSSNGNNASINYTTANDGSFSFDLPIDENYTISPEKNVNWLNGVTTYDLVLLSQHILGVNQLNSPYKIIAADASNDGKVTTFDIVELRALILHVVDELPNNDSWRFVDKSYQFPNAMNPFSPAYPEVININDLSQDMLYNDFIGVKIGDLNGDVVPSNLYVPEDRGTEGTMYLKVRDAELVAGQTYEVAFLAKDFRNILGYQFTLEFDTEEIGFAGVEAGTLPALSEGNFGLSKVNAGYITTSWNAMDVSLEDNDVLFKLRFVAQKNGRLSESLRISSALTVAEAYVASSRSDVELVFEDGDIASVSDVDGLQLFQNQPNPFRNSTTISFYLPEATGASLTIFDVSGKVLKSIEGDYNKGFHTVTINRSDIGSTGMLYYQLDTDKESVSKKMLMMD